MGDVMISIVKSVLMDESGISALLLDESGATAIEYGLLAALVSVAAIAALQTLGGNLVTMFDTISSNLVSAASSASSGA